MGILNKTDFKEIDLKKQTINYNKMEKLTLQDCFKYPNARILKTWDNGNSKTNIETFLWRQGENIGDDISDCKLILRPLSSLTDEEKKIIKSYFRDVYGYSDRSGINKYHIDNINWLDISSITVCCEPKYLKDLFDYLRSINIDIDNLQEKGVAVYE